MQLIFSAGWLYLASIILAICVVWIILKVRTIHEGSRMDGNIIPVAIVKKRGDGPVNDSADGILEKKAEYLKKVEETLAGALENYSADEHPLARAGILGKLGRLYYDKAMIEDRKDNLLKAAGYHYEGTQLQTKEEHPVEYSSSMVELGMVYVDLAEDYEREECLKRAVSAYGEALKIFKTETHPIERASTLYQLARALVPMSEFGNAERNYYVAQQALQKALAIYNEDKYAAEHRRADELLEKIKREVAT